MTDSKIKLKSGSYDLLIKDIPKEGNYPWGYIDFEKRELVLNSTLLDNRELFYQVLFHEVVHEALMNSGVSSFLAENDIQLEESICDSVGFALAEFVGKNPDIIKKMIDPMNGKQLFESYSR